MVAVGPSDVPAEGIAEGSKREDLLVRSLPQGRSRIERLPPAPEVFDRGRDAAGGERDRPVDVWGFSPGTLLLGVPGRETRDDVAGSRGARVVHSRFADERRESVRVRSAGDPLVDRAEDEISAVAVLKL